MSAHYNRHTDDTVKMEAGQSVLGGGPDDAAMDVAAEALRQTEVEAVRPDVTDLPDDSSLTPSKLDQMNIDELRDVAKQLDVPDRGKITDRDDLIAAIRARL
jgi:hypothetical protein